VVVVIVVVVLVVVILLLLLVVVVVVVVVVVPNAAAKWQNFRLHKQKFFLTVSPDTSCTADILRSVFSTPPKILFNTLFPNNSSIQLYVV
jgi:hypothetical protein